MSSLCNLASFVSPFLVAGGGRAGAAGSDESDAESIATHVTLDDLESVAGEGRFLSRQNLAPFLQFPSVKWFDSRIPEMGGTLEETHSLGDNLSEYMENAVHKT